MIIPVSSATEALALKDQLTADGLIIHKDYTWCYHPLQYSYTDPDFDHPPRAEFNFTDPVMESFYQLKWL